MATWLSWQFLEEPMTRAVAIAARAAETRNCCSCIAAKEFFGRLAWFCGRLRAGCNSGDWSQDQL